MIVITNLGALRVTTSHPLATLPRILDIVRERAEAPSYRNRASQPAMKLAVQIGLSGRGEVIGCNGRRCDLPPGSALIYVKGTGVEYGCPLRSREPWEFVYANIMGEAAVAIGHEVISQHGNRIDLGLRHPLIAALLSRVPDGDIRRVRWTAAENARISWEIIQALVNAAERDDEDLTLIDEAIQLLTARPEAPSDVATVARQLGVSREYLSRRFSQELGCSPAMWQREQRLHHARMLLKSGCAVADVAQRCGFSTASHFIQTFKRQYGATPAAYARAVS